MIEPLMVDPDPHLAAQELPRDPAHLARRLRGGLGHAGKPLARRAEPPQGAPLAPHELLDIGQGRGHVIEVRVELLQHALEGEQRLVHEVEVLRDPEPVALQDLRDPLHVGAEVDLPDRHPVVGLQQLGEVLLQLLLELLGVRGIVAREAQAQVVAGERIEVLLPQGDEDVREMLHVLLGHPADDPEIDQPDPAVRQDEDVPRVRIGVEQAVAQHHLEERRRPLERDLAAREPEPRERRMIVDPDALDPLHDQHPPGRPLPEDLGNAEVRAALEVLPEPDGVRRLDEEVELPPDGAAELVHDARRVVGLQLSHMVVDERRDPAQDADVAADGPLDVRPLHLHHDRPAVGQHGPVHLGDGRGGDGTGVKFGKKRLEGRTELLFHDVPGLGKGKGGDRIGQLGELGGILDGQQVGPAGEHLPQLDEGGAELLEEQPHALRRRKGPGRHAAPPDRRHAPAEGDEALQAGLLDEMPEAVARGHQEDLPDPGDVAVVLSPEAQEGHVRSRNRISPRSPRRLPASGGGC